MNVHAILKAIAAAADSAEALAVLISEAREVFSSDDQAQVDGALARLQAANDTLHERLKNKLAQAAKAD